MAKGNCSRYPIGTVVKVSDLDADAVPAYMIGEIYEIVDILRGTVELVPASGGPNIRITPIVLTRVEDTGSFR
jgi:hypothetical protein